MQLLAPMKKNSAFLVFTLRSALPALLGLIAGGIIFPALVAHWANGRGAFDLFFFMLFGQSVLALALAVLWFRRRIEVPMTALSALADEMAAGRYDLPLDWHRGDEPGRLAASLERARLSVRRTVAERQDIFNSLPVGVLYVRNRVIESANRRAEELLAWPPGRLAGCGTDILYPARDEFVDLGALAYATIERGETFCSALILARRDGSTFSAVLGGRALNPEVPQDGSVWSITELPKSGDWTERGVVSKVLPVVVEQ